MPRGFPASHPRRTTPSIPTITITGSLRTTTLFGIIDTTVNIAPIDANTSLDSIITIELQTSRLKTCNAMRQHVLRLPFWL